MSKLLLISALFLASCATQPRYIVGDCPKVKLPPEPDYCVYHLQKGDAASKVWKCYVTTVYQQRAWIKEAKIKTGNE